VERDNAEDVVCDLEIQEHNIVRDHFDYNEELCSPGHGIDPLINIVRLYDCEDVIIKPKVRHKPAWSGTSIRRHTDFDQLVKRQTRDFSRMRGAHTRAFKHSIRSGVDRTGCRSASDVLVMEEEFDGNGHKVEKQVAVHGAMNYS